MRVNTDAAERGALLPEGQYDAVIKRAEEKQSKAGNPMIELIVTVYGPDGTSTDVFDWLMSTDESQWKVKHCCDSAGIDYTPDISDQAFPGRNVRVSLKQRAREQGDKRKIALIPMGERQNSIGDYLLRGGVSVSSVNREANDDDIPF